MSRIRRRHIPIAAGIAVAALGLAVQSAPSTAAGTKTINVRDDLFSPKSTTISKGTTVTWRWREDGLHNVKSRGTKRFKSSALKTSGTHRYRFTKAGTYRYVCTVHEDEGMTGRVIVR